MKTLEERFQMALCVTAMIECKDPVFLTEEQIAYTKRLVDRGRAPTSSESLGDTKFFIDLMKKKHGVDKQITTEFLALCVNGLCYQWKRNLPKTTE